MKYAYFEGVAELQKGLMDRAKMDAVKKVVQHDGAQMQSEMMRNAKFRGHYEGSRFVPPTGATQRSITLELLDGGMSANVGPTTDYSPYVEYGTRFMEAQPFVRPTFNHMKAVFKGHMDQLFK